MNQITDVTTIIGQIGRDADCKQVGNTFNHAIKFPVAINQSWRDANGKEHEQTKWYTCVLWVRTYNFKQDMVKSFVGNENEVFDRNANGQNIDTKSWSKLQIKELDENGSEKEIWNVYNPLVTNVSFDKLDYGSEDTLKITVTVNYDWAELDSNAETFKAEVVNEYSSLGQPKKATVNPTPQIPMQDIGEELRKSAESQQNESMLERISRLFRPPKKEPPPEIE